MAVTFTMRLFEYERRHEDSFFAEHVFIFLLAFFSTVKKTVCVVFKYCAKILLESNKIKIL